MKWEKYPKKIIPFLFLRTEGIRPLKLKNNQQPERMGLQCSSKTWTYFDIIISSTTFKDREVLGTIL